MGNYLQDAARQLAKHEGTGPLSKGRHLVYTCTANKLTIGYGRNLEGRGLSGAEALMLLKNDLQDCSMDLREVFGKGRWTRFTAGRKVALMDMRFNLGGAGFRRFKNMIRAINEGYWDVAANEALNSRWAAQVKGRAKTVARQLKTGEVDA